jgi:hypothetical protein
MIRIGILSKVASPSASIKLIQHFKSFKITGIVDDIVSQDNSHQKYTIEELITNSDACYIDVDQPSFDLIQMGIKKSNHLFLRSVPALSIYETRQLINLVNEAGTCLMIFNPLTYVSENIQILDHLTKLKLISIRLKLDPEEFEKQFLSLLLYLKTIEKSEIKRIDVFALEGENQLSLINLRISFSTGSIAQIDLSEKFSSKHSFIEIFQNDESIISLPSNHIENRAIQSTEKNALQNFIHSIQKNPAIIISLSELEEALTSLNEIKDKLKYLNNTPLT